MNKYSYKKFSIWFLLSLSLLNCSIQPQQTDELKLQQTIPMPGVTGRIDHIAINIEKQIAYVAALGNNSVEAVDLQKGEVIYSIKNLSEPQGIVFIPENNSIVAANGGNGECDIFNADSFQKTGSIKLQDDADNIRYDSVSGKIYVGYGNGSIAVIDAASYKLISEIKLSGHPESFRLDKKENKIFVNVPDAHEISVIDLKTSTVTAQWRPKSNANFPMAIDEANHRLFIGCRRPSELEIIDTETGKIISSLDCSGDADDIFYNSVKKEIYISCGAGFIDVFKQKDKDNYQFTGKISTRRGARTSLFVPEFKKIILAIPKSTGNKAMLNIYSIN